MAKMKTHEEFVNEMKEVNPSFIIIGKYQGDNKHIEVECAKHHIWSSLPTNLRKGRGCPYCSGKKTLAGYNDIATTHPHLVKYFTNKDEAKMYSAGSHKRIKVTCPDCGEECEITIKNLTYYGFNCKICSDNISYPNKYLRALLKQLPIHDIEFEYYLEDNSLYRYDAYFTYKNQKYIIEMDGAFHYKETWFGSLEKTKHSDKEKDSLAIKNGIKLIRINCIRSIPEHIKNSILESELSYIFELKNIDWNLCEEFAANNLTKEICNYYNNNGNNVTDAMKEFCMCRGTIIKYLKLGSNLDWCKYNPNIIVKQKIDVIDSFGYKLYTFNNICECKRFMDKKYSDNFNRDKISKVCKKEINSYKGFIFEYAS